MKEDLPTEARTVVLIHGIKTFGDWQTRLEMLLKKQDPAIRVVVFRYGYFLALAFFIPPLRWFVVRRFRVYLKQLSSKGDTPVDIVAHSFGTYVATNALNRLPQSCRLTVDNLVLAGSVLRPRKNLAGLLTNRVNRIINDCGDSDVWPVVAQSVAVGMGAAGRFGLEGPTGPDSGIINRFFSFGHSGFFEATNEFPTDDDQFMREKWVPVLLRRNTEPLVQNWALARWWTPLLILLEPAKAALLLFPLLVIGMALSGASDREQTQRLLVDAHQLMETEPVSAFILALRADRLNSSKRTRTALVEAVEAIRSGEARRMSWDKDWSPGGLWSGSWRFPKNIVVRHPTLDFTLVAEKKKDGHDVLLIGSSPEQIYRLEPVSEGASTLGDVGDLRFSGSGNYVFVGRHAFFEIYNLRGERVSTQDEWITKGQWVFAELLGNDALLLACDNEGKVILFQFNENGEVSQLTEEHQLILPAALLSIDVNATGDRLFALHRDGYATWWAFDSDPVDKGARVVYPTSFKTEQKRLGYLVPLHQFGLPEVREANLKRPFNSLSQLDEEFIVWADMEEREGRTRFVTRFKIGDPSVWEADDDRVKHEFDLPHPESQVEFVGFGLEGSVLTLDAAITARVFAKDGALLDTERFDELFGEN